MNRRQLPLVLMIGAGLLAGVAGETRAQDFPSKTIKVIVPAAAGSGPDTLARIVSEYMARQLPHPVVVENIPGMAASLGTAKVLSEPADGHTMLFGFNQIAVMNPHVYRKLPYDPRNLAPVSLIGSGGYLLLAPTSAPYDSVAGLVAYARQHPGKLTYASTGTGGSQHLGMEFLRRAAGIELLHVPYKAGGTAHTDMIAGRIDLMIEPMSNGAALVRSGKVRALAVTRAQRVRHLPDVPTVAETLPGFELAGWNAVWVRTGTPEVVVNRLNALLRAALGDAQVVERLRERGYEAASSTPAQLAELTAREFTLWGDLIRKAGIQAE